MRPLLPLVSLLAFTAAPLLAQEGYRDTPILPGTSWHVHDPDRPKPPVVTPGETFSHMAPAPSDATVLFNGKDLSEWTDPQGEAAKWKVQDGYTESAKGTGMIRTKGKFADFQLHLEF